MTLSMTLQNKFDLAKKLAEGGNPEDGYIAKNGKTYTAYYTMSEWRAFLDTMKRQYRTAYYEYKNGDGGELFERRYPPKMASYGSSSRFIYVLSRDIPGFHFEKKLDICIPGRNENQEAQASLDGYLEPKCIFVEAKCREIYATSHPTFKAKYEDFYDYLANRSDHAFDYVVKESKDSKGDISPRVYFFWEEKPIDHFDFKQILCHLLGIAKKMILDKGKQTPTLLYLVYKPTEKHLRLLDNERTANAIQGCWETEKREATSVNMSLLYNGVVHFLYERKGVGQDLPNEEIERIARAFVFKFCDQDEYQSFLG